MDEATLKLLCRIEREMSLQRLTDLAFELLGNPVFYQDIALSVPFYTQCVSVADDSWQRIVNGEMLSTESIARNLGQLELVQHSRQGREPIALPPNPAHGNGKSNFAIPMVSGNQSYGVLILTSHCRPFQPEDKALFQLFGEIFYSKLLHNIGLGVTGISLTEQVLIRLLNGEPVNPAYLESRMNAMNWQPLPYCYLSSICAGETAGAAAPLDGIIPAFTRSHRNKLIRFQNSLIFIYSSQSNQADFREANPDLYQLLQSSCLQVGVSRPFTDLMELRQYWEQAQQALRVGRLLRPGETVYEFGSLAFSCALDRLGPEQICALIDPKVLQLWEKERQGGAPLLPTLEEYLACGMDASLAAQRLFIHKNTVRYRIGQCENQLGRSLARGDDVFLLQVSLKALSFLERTNQLPFSER